MIRLDLVLPDLRPWRYRMRTLFWGPFITGMFIVVILAVIPQSREVYLGIIDGQEYFRGLLGLALVMGLCGLLHCWQHMLGSAAIERLYPEHGDIRVDRGLLQLRDWLSRVSAFLPLIGLGVGLIKLFRDTSATADAVSTITSAEQQLIRGETGIEQGITTARLPFYVAGTAIVAALILIVFISFARSRASQRRLKRYSLRKIIMWSGAVLSAAAVILPLMFPGYVVPVARAMGPLAMTAIVLIAFVSVFMGLSFLSNLFRLPVTGAIGMADLGRFVTASRGSGRAHREPRCRARTATAGSQIRRLVESAAKCRPEEIQGLSRFHRGDAGRRYLRGFGGHRLPVRDAGQLSGICPARVRHQRRVGRRRGCRAVHGRVAE